MSNKNKKINEIKEALTEYFNLTLSSTVDPEVKTRIFNRILEIVNCIARYELTREIILDALILPLANFKRFYIDFSLDGPVHETEHLESFKLVNNSSDAIIELIF